MLRTGWRCQMAWMTLSLALAGCGHKDQSAKAEAAAGIAPAPAAEAPKLDPRLHQSFADATTKEPPDGIGRPPDTTLTGKSTGKIYTEVVARWDDVKFTTADGKKITYRAQLDTELGPIQIELLPEIAPNHVRSFVALARAGYFDGLIFERVVRQLVFDTAGAKPETKIEYIEGGCPLGTGQVDQGSIGYWLKPEFNAQILHEPGVVGAVHMGEEDVSGCKFYINLCKAPILDGTYTIFGKVTAGLDVATQVMNAPVRQNDLEFPDADRPVKPVVIRKVTILAGE